MCRKPVAGSFCAGSLYKKYIHIEDLSFRFRLQLSFRCALIPSTNMQRVLPCVVRLERRGKLLIQGCDVYIGHAWSKGGWQLPRSLWCNDFRIGSWHNSEVITQKYEEYVRNSPELFDSLDDLTGKVLGCWCKRATEAKKTCHGEVLIKLWKDRFPNYQEQTELWRTQYFPEGKDDTKLKVLRKKATAPQKRKATEEKAAPEAPKKKVRKVMKQFRNQTTHPEGVRYSGSVHAWPLVDHEWNPHTIWIDEAGMGCWAGPLHVGGTVILPGFDLQGIHDSKILKPHEREAVYEKLLQDPHIIWHVEAVPNTKVDELKLGGAWRYAIRRVITALKTRVEQTHPEITLDQVILDGNKTVLETDVPVTPIPKADRLYAGVSAASVLAKVSRDRYMTNIAPQYPEYFEIFTQGHGYRHSAKHDELIQAGKYTDLHRKSYKPLKDLLEKGVLVKVDQRKRTPPKVLTMDGSVKVVSE